MIAPSIIKPENRILQYNCQESSGLTLVDSSGNGRNGSIHSDVTRGASCIGRGVIIPNQSTTAFASTPVIVFNNASIMFWVRRDSAIVGQRYVATMSQTGGALTLYTDDSGTYGSTWFILVGSTSQYPYFGDLKADGKWHCGFISYDYTNGKFYSCLDNGAFNTTTTTGTKPNFTGSVFSFGRPTYSVGMTLTHITAWNTVLTEKEYRAMYHSAKGAPPP